MHAQLSWRIPSQVFGLRRWSDNAWNLLEGTFAFPLAEGPRFMHTDGLVWLPHISAVSQESPQYSDPELSVGANPQCPGFSRRFGMEDVPSSLEVLDQSAH